MKLMFWEGTSSKWKNYMQAQKHKKTAWRNNSMRTSLEQLQTVVRRARATNAVVKNDLAAMVRTNREVVLFWWESVAERTGLYYFELSYTEDARIELFILEGGHPWLLPSGGFRFCSITVWWDPHLELCLACMHMLLKRQWVQNHLCNGVSAFSGCLIPRSYHLKHVL